MPIMKPKKFITNNAPPNGISKSNPNSTDREPTDIRRIHESAKGSTQKPPIPFRNTIKRYN
jgi:hypothetical protein